LQLGIEPPKDCTTLADVLNAFDDDKKAYLDAGTINDRTYKEYMDVCEVIATLGKHRPFESITPLDLKQLNHKLGRGKRGKPVSPVTHKRLLTYARMVFLFANEILDCNVKYRKALKSPEKSLIRERREAAGERWFSDPAEIRALLAKADDHLKAIIYLGVNCGFGPHDCIKLPASKIVDGFHTYARPKTHVARRCPLWSETQAAIQAVASGEHVLNGRVWNRHVIAHQFKTLCETCGIYKAGITTPYSLRRTFETVAKNADVNQSVIDRIMGHERPDMSEVYNQKTFDKQLIRCTDFVRGWLLGTITL
jgi:integrase